MSDNPSAESIAGFAGIDDLLKWAESGESTGGERTQAVLKALSSEVRKLRDLRERQAAMIRRLQATIEEYEEQAVDEGRC